MGVVNGVEAGEGLVEFVAGNGLVVDVEPGLIGWVVVGGLEPFGEVLALGLDLAELLLDPEDRKGGVGYQVEQVGLFGVQAMELGDQLLLEEPSGGLLVGQGCGDVLSDVVDELRAEPDGGVVVLDGVLDPDDVDVGRCAAAVLLVAAEEVGVLGATVRISRNSERSKTFR